MVHVTMTQLPRTHLTDDVPVIVLVITVTAHTCRLDAPMIENCVTAVHQPTKQTTELC